MPYVIVGLVIIVVVTVLLIAILKNSKTHVVEVIRFDKCKVELCKTHYYPEIAEHSYTTALLISSKLNLRCVSDNYDIYKACKRYVGQTVVCDINVSINSDGSSKIVINSVAEKTLKKAEVHYGINWSK